MKNMVLSAIVGAVVAFVLVTVMVPKSGNDAKAVQLEPVYERIIKNQTVRCGYAVWPPFFVKDPNSGEMSGIGYDFFETMAKSLGLKVEWTEEVGYGNYIEGLNTNRYDAFCTTVWPDAGRMAQTTLTVPTYYSTLYAYVRADDTRFDSDVSLINNPDVKIAAIEGDVTYSISQLEFPKAALYALSQMEDGGAMLMAVKTGKADVALLDEGIAEDFLATNLGSIRKVENAPPVQAFGEHISIPKGEYQLKNMFDTAITTMINSGTAERILKKYKGSYYPQQRSFKTDWR